MLAQILLKTLHGPSKACLWLNSAQGLSFQIFCFLERLDKKKKTNPSPPTPTCVLIKGTLPCHCLLLPQMWLEIWGDPDSLIHTRGIQGADSIDFPRWAEELAGSRDVLFFNHNALVWVVWMRSQDQVLEVQSQCGVFGWWNLEQRKLRGRSVRL